MLSKPRFAQAPSTGNNRAAYTDRTSKEQTDYSGVCVPCLPAGCRQVFVSRPFRACQFIGLAPQGFALGCHILPFQGLGGSFDDPRDCANVVPSPTQGWGFNPGKIVRARATSSPSTKGA